MGRVTFGISPECLCHDVRDNVRRVRALEEAGFDYIWEGDHTLPWQHSPKPTGMSKTAGHRAASAPGDGALRQAFSVATSGEEIIQRFEAFIKAGCTHILWADMSPDPSLVAKVCAAEVLPYLKKKHGNAIPQPA